MRRFQPRKRFGQNFLRDPGVIRDIAHAIGPQSQEHLVEIGPGLGALTRPLLESGCRLEAIELDRDLATPLLAAFSIYPGFTLHQADALSFDLGSLAAPDEKLRIVGNLPYNISTPLIFHLLDSAGLIEDMHFMLQKEVVDRLTAGPGDRDWGRLGIMTQCRCRAEMLFEVPPEAFDPPPQVQSAIVRLEPLARPKAAGDDASRLDQVVRLAFAQRRKTLRNSLKELFEAQALQDLGLDPGARPETLSLEQFLALAGALDD